MALEKEGECRGSLVFFFFMQGSYGRVSWRLEEGSGQGSQKWKQRGWSGFLFGRGEVSSGLGEGAERVIVFRVICVLGFLCDSP